MGGARTRLSGPRRGVTASGQAMSSERPRAERLLDRALCGPVVSGTPRLICVDGLAGSGKTTLADGLERAAVERALTVTVVHTDDLLAGWGGLLEVGSTVLGDVVEPLRVGRPASYRRYDWEAGAFAELVAVPAVDVVIIEGCGSAPPGVDGTAALVVYVEAPDNVRLERGLERDGAGMRPEWLAWMADERRLAARDRTRERANVVVDTTPAVVDPR